MIGLATVRKVVQFEAAIVEVGAFHDKPTKYLPQKIKRNREFKSEEELTCNTLFHKGTRTRENKRNNSLYMKWKILQT